MSHGISDVLHSHMYIAFQFSEFMIRQTVSSEIQRSTRNIKLLLSYSSQNISILIKHGLLIFMLQRWVRWESF